MWKMQEKPKTVLASKALVKEFFEMEPAPHDRPLSENRLRVYEKLLKAGEFRPVTWASALCHETNCIYRVNGKHTATMLSKLDPIPDFHVTIERYVCDTLNDVASLYNTFDSKLASRTTRDMNLAFAATIRELDNVPERFIHYTVTAAAVLKQGLEKAKDIPPAEKAELLIDAYPFAVWLTKLMPSGTRSGTSYYHLSRTPVVNAMMATWNRAPQKAEEFWSLVISEEARTPDHPTRQIGKYLLRVALAGGATTGHSRNRTLVTPREIYVKCLHAWNAWRKDEPTTLRYVKDAPVPAVK